MYGTNESQPQNPYKLESQNVKNPMWCFYEDHSEENVWNNLKVTLEFFIPTLHHAMKTKTC